MSSKPKQNNPKNNFYHKAKRKMISIFSKSKNVPINQHKPNECDKASHSEIYIKGDNNVKWTDVAMVVINLILAFFTYSLFQQATIQSQQSVIMAAASENAIKLSKESFEEAKKYNDKTFAIQDKISKENAIQDSIRVKRETIRFDAANRPYMSFYGVKFDIAFDNTTNHNNYRANILLNNYGKNSAILLEYKTTIEFTNDSGITKKPIYKNKEQVYTIIPPQVDINHTPRLLAFIPKISNDTLQLLYAKKLFFNVFAEMTYKDVYNKKYKSYCCFLCGFDTNKNIVEFNSFSAYNRVK